MRSEDLERIPGGVTITATAYHSGRYFSTRDSDNDQWGRNYEIHGTNGGWREWEA